MSTPPELSAIVLCYRAGESTLRVVGPLHQLLRESGISFELLLVANFDPETPDSTASVARGFASEHDSVAVLASEKQGGMGWDMRSGLAAARGEYMVVIDGDAQNPVEDVLQLYREMKQTGADVGKGRRIARFDSAYRRFLTLVYNATFRALFGTKGLWDINGKPKGLTRSAFSTMRLNSDDWFIDAEIVIKAHRNKLTVVELPVVFRANQERSSFVTLSAIWEFVVNLTRASLRRS